MIFVTVGSMLPFDRLIRVMDDWAGDSGEEVYAQVGEASYLPRNMKWVRSLDPADFRGRCAAASLIVSHAGMGTVITAAEYGRPLIVVPRRADLKEVTSDHQIATARWLRDKAWIRVVDDEQSLPGSLEDPPVGLMEVGAGGERTRLIEAIKDFIAFS